MKHQIWYLDEKKQAHNTKLGGDDLDKVIEQALLLRAVRVDGKRKYPKVWIAGDLPGVMAYFTDTPEPVYEGIRP